MCRNGERFTYTQTDSERACCLSILLKSVCIYIVELAYSEMIVEESITDSVVKFPTIITLKNTVNKQRRKSRPAIPKRIANIPHPIPILYSLTKQNSAFFLYDGQLGESRALVFGSIKILVCRWYVLYIAVYFLSVLQHSWIFALFADKQESTYYDLFGKLFEKMRELPQTIQLQSIIIDYKLAVKNVVNKSLPHVNVRKRKMICLVYKIC